MNPTAKNYGSADARLYTFKIKIKKAVEAPNPLQPPCSTLLQCFLSIFYRRLSRCQNKILFNELYNTSQQYSFIQFLRICLL